MPVFLSTICSFIQWFVPRQLFSVYLSSVFAMMRRYSQGVSVLDNELKSRIQGSYSRFLDAKGLRSRYAQKQMIAAVARQLGEVVQDDSGNRLGEKHVIAVEAGTGTGKTIAYLLAALPIAQARGKRLIVSTATVALQEQLIHKDLPELAEKTDLSFRFEIAKGRRRYLCINKLESSLEQQDGLNQMALYEDEIALRLGPEDLKLYKGLMDEYASGRWSGDKDELSVELDEAAWLPLTSDHHQCTNRRCANFNACPFFRSRGELEQADLIVVNHDLVLADLSLGGGAILPEPSDAIYLFDEAHHLGEKATGHFALSMRTKASDKQLRGFDKMFKQLLDESDNALVIKDTVERMQRPVQEVQHALGALDQRLDEELLLLQEHERRRRYERGEVPGDIRELALQLSVALTRLDALAESLLAKVKEGLEGEQSELDKGFSERWTPVLGGHWARIQRMSWLARSFAHGDEPGALPTARWIVKHDNEMGVDTELHSAPVSARDHLKDLLWDHCYAAVLTSATLTALGSFDTLFTQLGLPLDTPGMRLASPFDYAANARLEVPLMRSDPGKADEHTEEVAQWLAAELPKLSAVLVLFTSWRQMNRIIETLDETLLKRVIPQGDLSKQAMLQTHRERIDKGEPSILFGLASFAEGVDLPGDYLKDVIICKLPFSVPDDPVDATLAEWVEERGGNAFQDISVPAASVKLTQAVGRLLRTETDSGRVVLLDRRVVTRRYGQALLNALPPFQRIIHR